MAIDTQTTHGLSVPDGVVARHCAPSGSHLAFPYCKGQSYARLISSFELFPLPRASESRSPTRKRPWLTSAGLVAHSDRHE